MLQVVSLPIPGANDFDLGGVHRLPVRTKKENTRSQALMPPKIRCCMLFLFFFDRRTDMRIIVDPTMEREETMLLRVM